MPVFLLLTISLLSLFAASSHAANVNAANFEFPSSLGETRSLVFLLLQVKSYFEQFILGALIWIPLLELYRRIRPGHIGVDRADTLTRRLLGLVIIVFVISLILTMASLLLFGLFFSSSLTQAIPLFKAVLPLYSLGFIVLTTAMIGYYYTWPKSGVPNRQWIHTILSAIVGASAFGLLLLGNSWSALSRFNAESPDYFSKLPSLLLQLFAIPNAFRTLDAILFGGAVLIFYAGYLSTKTATEMEAGTHNHFIRMFFLGLLLCLFALPFESYWLGNELVHASMGLDAASMARYIGILEILRTMLMVAAIAWPLLVLSKALGQESQPIGANEFSLYGVLGIGILTPLWLLIRNFNFSQAAPYGLLVMSGTTLLVIVTGIILILLKPVSSNGEATPRRIVQPFGPVPVWIFIGFFITVATGLAGYIRSVLKQLGQRPETFDGRSHALAFAMGMIVIEALVFWAGLLVIFRLTQHSKLVQRI